MEGGGVRKNTVQIEKNGVVKFKVRCPEMGGNLLFHSLACGTMLYWPWERQQRTLEDPAPCEAGLSGLPGDSTHTQLLPQQTPLCSFIKDGLLAAPITTADGKRHKHHNCQPGRERLAVTDTILIVAIWKSPELKHMRLKWIHGRCFLPLRNPLEIQENNRL